MADIAESRGLLGVARRAALAVREPLLAAFRSEIAVDYKQSRHDVVTIHDKEAEATISAIIREAVPDSTIVGEEGGTSGNGRIQWYVDPIDGTSNFARGLAFWCVSVAAVVDDDVVAGVVYDPVTDNLFCGDLECASRNGRPIVSRAIPEEKLATLITGYPVPRDFRLDGRERALARLGTLVETFSTVRRPGSAALSIAHVAAGWMDAAAGFGVNAWDVAAALLILRRAGGRYIPLPMGKVDDDAAAHLYPGYVAIGEGGDYPTLLKVARDISDSRRG